MSKQVRISRAPSKMPIATPARSALRGAFFMATC
jgi:hypothetical protein